ncbi:hypothetical protein H0E87_000544 [Populus deltoides]|uniref:Anaphase-promoting complex subunit 6 n=1 Tax=Populus deltoides TaxID=3696 RepID=A0A8T2ZMA5_POPDE|nr:hypothetical protein H0E87_000544 [Populus deltoides]
MVVSSFFPRLWIAVFIANMLIVENSSMLNKAAVLLAIRSRRWVALFILVILDKKVSLCASLKLTLVPSSHYGKKSVVEAKFREVEKESCNSNPSSPSIKHTLKNDTDLLACKAEYFNQCGEYQKCFELTSDLLEKDPFHLKCTLVHIAAAMELGNSNELYLMASNLVKDYPQKALSWFAVGCCYYCIKKYDQSRRYFSKATSLDGTFAPAWIGFGNAYAAQEEGDKAMSAYRTAARLFSG